MNEFVGPAATKEVSGHEGPESEILRAIASDRLHHAWLLSGPQGIGKATFAYRLTKFLLTEDGRSAGGLFGTPPDSLSVSPEAPAARQVAGGAHPNLQVLQIKADEKTGKLRRVITVEQVRESNHFLQMTAGAGGRRVVLVDAIDDMNRNAANAFLKKLEEPPANTVFLLVNHAKGQTLPTIRSRCRSLVFKPLSDDQVVQVLDSELPDFDAEQKKQLASLADGSPGRAMALADGNGLELLEDMLAVFETLPNLDILAANALAEKAGGRGKEEAYATLVDLMGWWLARLVGGLGRQEENAERAINPAETALRIRLGTIAPLDRWAAMWEKTGQLFRQAAAINLDRKQTVLQAFMDIEAEIASS